MNITKRHRRTGLLCILLTGVPGLCHAETLALNTDFVKKYKDKVTISTHLRVDVHPSQPHAVKSGGDDGDIHMAGRDDVILLPLVAEIVNARLENAAIQRLMQSSPSHPIDVTGVWRIWFEHLGKADQIQGATVPAPTTSNPAHLFEIHPITSFDGVSVLDSFVEIKDGGQTYTAYSANTAFPFYEKNPATIQASKTAIMITAGEGKYNYTEFVLEPAGQPQDVGDGYLVLANVYDKSDPEQEVTSSARRMVFVKDSPPAKALSQLPKGGRLHVLGIPRVNLAEVFAIAAKNGTSRVSANLPYEMIVVAVLQ